MDMPSRRRVSMGEKMDRVNTELLHLKGDNHGEIARKVADSLLKGGVCVVPTDTIYGIVALEEFGDAVRRVYEVKKRPIDKPFIRLIGSVECLKRYTEQELPGELAGYWPGPLTIIFRGIREETVAIRLPDAPFLNRLFTHLGNRGIVAPSANLSGEENIFDCDDLAEAFSGLVDTIVCLSGGPLLRKPSTIIDISGPRWKIIREGAVDIKL